MFPQFTTLGLCLCLALLGLCLIQGVGQSATCPATVGIPSLVAIAWLLGYAICGSQAIAIATLWALALVEAMLASTQVRVWMMWPAVAVLLAITFGPLWTWQTGGELGRVTCWVLAVTSATVIILAYTIISRPRSGHDSNLGLLAAAAAGGWCLWTHAEAATVGELLWTTVAGLGAWALGLVSYGLKLLSRSGALAAALLGSLLFASQGAAGAVPLLGFFLLSSGLSKIAKRLRPEVAKRAEKGDRRDAHQVFANAGPSLVCAFLFDATGVNACYIGLLAGLCAATADTWATEIGSFSPTRPREITTGKPVEAGRSGGVTVLGTCGAALGAGTTCALGWAFVPEASLELWAAIVGIAVLACFVDSVLGATYQARYQVPATGAWSEAASRDGFVHIHVGGYRWMNNDVVNLSATSFAAVLGVLAGLWLL